MAVARILILFGLTTMVTTNHGRNIKHQPKIVCQGRVFRLDCPLGYGLDILSANYGRTNKYLCNFTNKTIQQIQCISQEAKKIIETKCNNKRHCSMVANNIDMGGDPCPNVSKYVDIIYQCAPSIKTNKPPYIVTTVTKKRFTTTMKPTEKHVSTKVEPINTTFVAERIVTTFVTERTLPTFATERIVRPGTTVKTKATKNRRKTHKGFFRSMLIMLVIVKDKPRHSMLSVMTGIAAGTIIILVTVVTCVCLDKKRQKKCCDSFDDSDPKKDDAIELEKSELLGGTTGRNSDSTRSARSDDHVDSAFGDDEPEREKANDYEMSEDMAYLDSYLQEYNQNKSLPRPPVDASNPRGSLRMSRRAHNDGSKGRNYDYNSNNGHTFSTFS